MFYYHVFWLIHAVLIYQMAGEWTQYGAILYGGGDQCQFGHSVAIDGAGDTVVVGAPYCGTSEGYIYVYKTSPVHHGKLQALSMGKSVTISVGQ